MKKLFLPTRLKDYYRFFQVPARKWWYGLFVFLAIIVIAFGLLLLNWLFPLDDISEDADEWAPAIGILVGNLEVGGLFIGIAVLVAWLLFRQGFGWLSSVVGRFRWKWFAVTIAVFGTGLLLWQAGKFLFFDLPEGIVEELAIRPYTVFILVVLLLTVPLQSAGEEFLVRGLLGRSIAAAVPFRKIGLILSVLISSLIFMLLHQEESLSRNLMFFSWGLMMWWLAYRTGGIEASIAFHAVNNLLEQWPLPFVDLNEVSTRGKVDLLSTLLMLVIQLILILIIDLLARRRNLVRMSSPAAAIPEVVKASSTIFMKIESSVELATKEDLPRFDTTIREVLPDNS